MALVTLCPDCSTTFRINSAQLQAHGGEVRCGQCRRVFNGFATLITVDESAIAYPPEPQLPSGTAEAQAVIQSTEVRFDSTDDLSSFSGWDEDKAESREYLFDRKPVKRFQGLWASANFILLLLLMGQGIYSYRTELTIMAPYIRPYLEKSCSYLACTVPYSQDIRLLGIETSDLQKSSARKPEITTMHATIRNHAAFPQLFPALQLLLLDTRDQLIASRIFTPQDYLLEGDKELQFIGSMKEIDIRLDFDSSQLDALGYRLHLLYL